VEVIVDFIDANRDELGVEPICKELQVAPSTYYAAKSRPLSARAIRDAMLIPMLVALWSDNFKVYGVRKLWRAARRAGHDVGRDQVARLMGAAGIEGRRKGKKRRTTKPDPAAERHPDLVERDFSADRPNALWVSDLTYVATWEGFAYVYFITDAFSRMIVGWRVATHMRTDMVLDALEMARWRRGTLLEGLVSHTDAGSQFTSVRYGERLDELGAVPSIGSVGDAFDNALAESVNGSYKEELIRGPGQGPWRNVDDVELATLAWVHWWNEVRLHEGLDYVPPAEFEENWAKANARTILSAAQSPASDEGDRTGPQDLALSGQL
jgi:putative transposase